MKYIRLTKGYVAKVSDSDFESLSKFKWRVTFGGGRQSPYAVRSKRKTDDPSMPNNIYMHRQVMDFPKGMVVDHLNNDTLDNRRENLEVTTTIENNRRNMAFTMQSHWGKGAPPLPGE